MPDLLQLVVNEGVSDLHIEVGAPPMVRLHGDLTPLNVAEWIRCQRRPRSDSKRCCIFFRISNKSWLMTFSESEKNEKSY